MDKFGIITFIVILSFGSARSEPEESDNEAAEVTWPPYDSVRLPGSLRPTLYNITLKPFIYKEMGNDSFYYFACATTIYLDCYNDTDIIRLHMRQHNVYKITLAYTDDSGTYRETDLTVYRENNMLEIIEIQAGLTLKSGEKYMLTIVSVGKITNFLTGLYYSPYKENGETRYIFTTMMEPTSARLVFPCFDAPDFKAVFLLNIFRKDDMICISNLPRRVSIGPDEDGYYIDVFDEPRNVPMSTYLVAFACGDIDYLESHVDGIQFRTYSRRNVVNLTEFALEVGVKTLKYFQDYFQVPYPLPKEDMIAVPTMSFNAMEHWGMITYREEAMLFEQGVNSEMDKEWTAILVAHEISHQWFGNIVSPQWWDDLWLNEGFATYMMFLATDRVLPEWNMMNKQVTDFRGVQNVFSVDDKLTSHPVYIPVSNPTEINEIFDLISYAKGSAVIRMMNFFLGEATFKNGLTRYLHDFSFKTATHNDLWQSLEQQAVEDNCTVTNVKLIMDTWLLEKNYPVVMVTRLGDNTLHLSQSAFLIDEEERKERENIFWEIPVTYTTDTELNFEKSAEDIAWLHKDGEDVNVTDSILTSATWVIANIRQYGYFRVNYDPDNWQALIGQLNTDPFVIHPINRAQIINDAWNLAKAGLLHFETALQTLDYLDRETDYVPWKAALRELKSLRNALQLTPLYGLFEDFMQLKLTAAYYDISHAESHYDIIQEAMLAGEACRYGIEDCVKNVIDIFDSWIVDENIGVDPNIKGTVYCNGVAHGGREAWDHVLHVYNTTDSPGEKMVLLAALACTKEPWIIAKLLDLTVSSDVFSETDRITVVSYVAENPVGRLMTWGYLEENWDVNFERYGSGLNLFADLIKSITGPFNTPAELRRVELFVESKKDLGTAERQFQQALVDIRAKIDWLEKHYDHIETWLKKELS